MKLGNSGRIVNSRVGRIRAERCRLAKRSRLLGKSRRAKQEKCNQHTTHLAGLRCRNRRVKRERISNLAVNFSINCVQLNTNQAEALRRMENAARRLARTVPAKSRTNELDSGVETGGGGSGMCGVLGVPGGRSGGVNGGGEVFEWVCAPGGSSGTTGTFEASCGNRPNPSAGRNRASRGSNTGVLNSSFVGSETATGSAATLDRRFAQRTRAKFSPSEIKLSPAGMTILFFVQKTWLLRRYETYIASG